jgi:hypothetical protein
MLVIENANKTGLDKNNQRNNNPTTPITGTNLRSMNTLVKDSELMLPK